MIPELIWSVYRRRKRQRIAFHWPVWEAWQKYECRPDCGSWKARESLAHIFSGPPMLRWKSCSQRCKSFKVSTALCGFQHNSLLTYSLNHLPLFPLFLALFINSCTVNSPWPSSFHFTLSLSRAFSLFLHLASVLLRGCSDRESRGDLSKGCCCQVNGKSFTCLFEALLNVPGALLQIGLMDYCHL